MDAVNERLPDPSSYCYSLLKDLLVTYYTISKKGTVCSGVSMERGVSIFNASNTGKVGNRKTC
jgi:hypothetical protein